MAVAYIEHRPKSTDPKADVTSHVIVVDGKEVESFRTQKEAKDAACARGYRPVHVARERHLRDKDNPDHFREDRC